jgi:GNAT superfamily N-acetyltransferase
MSVVHVPPSRITDAVGVLCDAFSDYPVMRFVLGPEADYDLRLRTLVGFFVAARTLRQEPVLGVADATGSLAAVATVTLPGDRPPPPALQTLRETVWAELGDDARERYETFAAAGRRFIVDAPHHHLNMIGVRRSHAGRGLGRRLLDGVHDLARGDAASTGVSLTTERHDNVLLYEHFGYRLLGHTVVAGRLETWSLFRPARA